MNKCKKTKLTHDQILYIKESIKDIRSALGMIEWSIDREGSEAHLWVEDLQPLAKEIAKYFKLS